MSKSNIDAVEPQGQVRTDFPETWMWASKTAANGRAIFPGFAPDTITDFVANAYAIHPVTGLGVAPVTSNLTVFLPFFVNLQLPYSVIRGELAVIQANVFNYRGNGSTEYATVRLKFSKEYDIISVNGAGVEKIQTEDYVQCVKTTQGGVTPVFFYIRPNTIGTIELSVRATIPRPVNIFDEVIRQLPVKAEGIQKSKNQPVLISIQTPGTQVATRNITFPNVGLVPESEKIRVTIIGDLFGPSLANIDDVVNLPSGTGEQNLLSFGPAVYATVYMKSTGRFDGNVALQDKIRKILMTGYQRELIFQRGDGSFSDFGNADDSGSLWLTSFVVRIFAQAAQLDLITIDSKVVDRAVKYIINQQTTSGNFVSTGTLAHPSMQGGSSSSVNSLTAFILIALNEVKTADILTDPSTIASLTASISSATSFLVGRIPTMTTDYERAICAYALVKTSVAQANTILTRLESSPNLTIEGNSKYWKNDMSSSLTTETTAYVLLTYSVKNDRANGLLVLQWLVKQRNAFGGFSTQDTIVGLHALTEFARLIYSKSVDLTLYIRSKTNGVEKLEATLTLTSDNHDVLQYVDIPDVVDEIIVRGAGTGLALVDIIQFYNIKQEALPPKFDLKITTSDETLLSYALRVCASYNFPQSGSNMAILDVGFISGFEPEIDKVDVTGNLKRKELAGGRLILYFNEIPSKPVCVDVVARRLSYVIGVRSATVVLYSYYNPEERTMKEYLPSNLKALGLCRLCPTCCAPKVLPLSTCGSRQ
ncbi:C3 and PZP-like alpha-2-macroglobulin domain-containing protein 8 [Dreissena polymorpha]|uniref:C3 and PZP-like alpha-2-macroglobulin domain-containing protein 8 n=1 Tax=Dreissena polymorpha TaxID=45954 RepID=UPI002264C86E|nr:C3 and PZP-like alpha-2-macroglobulin domain-containing protein 8 [Dreissena polymorpha]